MKRAGVFLVLLFMCAFAPMTAWAAQTVVLFDQGHREMFRIDSKERLDLSTLADTFVAEGYAVRGTYGALTPERLATVDVLVISGPLNPPSEAEVKNIVEFLERGGRLAVMVHIAPTVMPLFNSIGVGATRGPITETGPVVLGGKGKDFLTSRIDRSHPLFEGIESFSLYGAWGLKPIGRDVSVLATTSGAALVDENQNSLPDAGEDSGEIAVALQGMVGKGMFVIFGDDAIFQNAFIEGDNLRLAGNLARWLKK